jgi:hypothetical protein
MNARALLWPVSHPRCLRRGHAIHSTGRSVRSRRAIGVALRRAGGARVGVRPLGDHPAALDLFDEVRRRVRARIAAEILEEAAEGAVTARERSTGKVCGKTIAFIVSSASGCGKSGSDHVGCSPLNAQMSWNLSTVGTGRDVLRAAADRRSSSRRSAFAIVEPVMERAAHGVVERSADPLGERNRHPKAS